MGYELSTCFRGSGLVFKKLTQKFEASRICATRYGFDLKVQMQLSDEFAISHISGEFAKDIGLDILEPAESGGLNHAERAAIATGAHRVSKATEEASTMSEEPDATAMLSVADLFKVFLAGPRPYKSVIVSTIVNYGVDASMSHQCALMALGPPYNVFLFYEPYGLYAKFGKSYKHCFRDILGIFTRLDNFRHYSVGMYHDYFMKGSQGIQGMMIDQARENRQVFAAEYNRIKRLMGATGTPWKYENDEYDKTFEGSTLMEMASDHPEVIEAAAILYRNNSAKICVSIFLVESARLMHALSEVDQFGPAHVPNYMSRWYQNFSTRATAKLLTELSVLVGSLYPKIRQEIFAAFRNPRNSASDICRLLTSSQPARSNTP
jgi:hypothetical protein